MVEFLMAPTYNIVKTDIIVRCKMYYDKIERELEGFYPILNGKNSKNGKNGKNYEDPENANFDKEMYYNKIDRECEGFYPELKYKNGYESVIIKFQLCYYHNVPEYWWTQISEGVIYGFTNKNGKQLLDVLNENVKNVVAKKIYNAGGRCVYPIAIIDSTYHLIDQESILI